MPVANGSQTCLGLSQRTAMRGGLPPLVFQLVHDDAPRRFRLLSPRRSQYQDESQPNKIFVVSLLDLCKHSPGPPVCEYLPDILWEGIIMASRI